MDSKGPGISGADLIGVVENNAPFARLNPGIHGKSHARRVLLFAQAICALEGGDHSPDRDLIIVASLLHDCGRKNDGNDPFHADRSALLALAFCTEQDIHCDRNLLADTIRFHCKSGCYQWADPPLEAKILADADKLDRFRFHHQRRPLDESLLLLPQSHMLIPLAASVNNHPDAD